MLRLQQQNIIGVYTRSRLEILNLEALKEHAEQLGG